MRAIWLVLAIMNQQLLDDAGSQNEEHGAAESS
jgi:hypothetical protein